MSDKKVVRGQGRSRRGKREVNERYVAVDWPRDLFNRARRRDRKEIEEGEGEGESGTREDDRSKTGSGNRLIVENIQPNNDRFIVENIQTNNEAQAEERDIGLEYACTPHFPSCDDTRNCLTERADFEADIISLEDEMFFMDNAQQRVVGNDILALVPQVRNCALAVTGPSMQGFVCVGGASAIASPALEHSEEFSASRGSVNEETALKWQGLFALLLCGGTVRMTVEYYETLRETLLWQSQGLGKRQDALPGIRKIQRVLMPFVRESCYAKSEIVSFEKKNGGTAQVQIVAPSEWAIRDMCTAPLFDSTFDRHLSAPVTLFPLFKFGDIENTPSVRKRRGSIEASRCIFVDAPQMDHVEHSPRLPVVAEPGDRIQVRFRSCDEACIVFGFESSNGMQSESSFKDVSFSILSIWELQGDQNLQSGVCVYSKLFDKCRNMSPGDTVAELSPLRQAEDLSHSFILLYRFRRFVSGEPMRQLYIIPNEALGRGELNPDHCSICQVRSVELISTTSESSSLDCGVPCTGYLKDGRKYVVYRVLLYCDDFQPHSSKTSSYGGCYMLPMGIPPAQRAGYGAVRCIGLTPPQVSTNKVLQYIIPDLVKCSTTGVPGLDPQGNPITIFIDVLGFIGDYPAVSHALDVLGHNSRAPCHLCCFIRQDRIGQGSLPYYGHTTEIHSKSTSFYRSVTRMNSVRSGENSLEELNSLGFKSSFSAEDQPLHALSKALSAARGFVPFTDRDEPVVSAKFDPYRSTLVAPDHLLFGLAQDILRATISLCTPNARRTADSLMRSSLSTNHMAKHRQIINAGSASLNSMGMSDMFALLLVAPTCFENALHLENQTHSECSGMAPKPAEERPAKKRRISRAHSSRPPHSSKTSTTVSPGRSDSGRAVRSGDILELLTMFQQLVRETHFWPIASTDGAGCIEEFNRQNGYARLDALYGLAVKYISMLHDLCVRDNGGVGKYLNKPNVHRLLELYTHTIPAFGHCKHVQELLFETAHQPLKRAIVRSNQRDPHIHAVTATLANDWECRLSIEVSQCGDPEHWTMEDCKRLLRLIGGRDEGRLEDMRRVRDVFCEPVLSQLRKVKRRLSSSVSDLVEWRMQFDEPGMRNNYEGWRHLTSFSKKQCSRAIECIANSVEQRSFEPTSVRIACYASSWHVYARQKVSRRYFGDIYPGSVVQALVADLAEIGNVEEVRELETPRSETDFHSESFQVSFWLVIGIFEARYLPICERDGERDGESDRASRTTGGASFPYAVVLPCSGMSEKSINSPVRVEANSNAYILPLGHSVRETMCIHACARTVDCTVSGDIVQHSGFIGDGTPFYALGRRQGYPPRIG